MGVRLQEKEDNGMKENRTSFTTSFNRVRPL